MAMQTKPADDYRDPWETGRRVLEALDRGRARAHAASQARADALRRAVERLAADDAARGRPTRGRPARIARRLHGLASERHVRRILSDGFSCVSD